MPGPYIFKDKTPLFKAIYIIGSKTSLNWGIHEYDSEAGTGSVWNYLDSATGQGTTSLLLKTPPLLVTCIFNHPSTSPASVSNYKQTDQASSQGKASPI